VVWGYPQKRYAGVAVARRRREKRALVACPARQDADYMVKSSCGMAWVGGEIRTM